MTAAILQGVPATTLDTDIWLELPERRYVKALDIAKKLGAEILARTVVALADDTLAEEGIRFQFAGMTAAARN